MSYANKRLQLTVNELYCMERQECGRVMEEERVGGVGGGEGVGNCMICQCCGELQRWSVQPHHANTQPNSEVSRHGKGTGGRPVEFVYMFLKKSL